MRQPRIHKNDSSETKSKISTDKNLTLKKGGYFGNHKEWRF